MSRTHGSERAKALHFSLLTSLGLFPFACGGSITTAGGDAGHGGALPMVDAEAGSPANAGGALQIAGAGGALQIAGAGGALQIAGAAPGGAAGGGPRAIPACVAPTLDPISQLVKCADGARHRPLALDCAASAGVAGQASGEDLAAGAAGASSIGQPCQSDSDCSGLLRGYCSGLHLGPVTVGCESGCLLDSDCAADQLCACNGSPHFGECAPATCHVDSDCAPGSRCAESVTTCGLTPSFACIASEDECLTSADCGRLSGGACVLEGTHRVCSSALCGRPFLVAELVRLARLVPSRHWLTGGLDLPELAALSPTARTLLAAHWAKLGQMEHASIAAFARFNLQLLSLGAPSSLVEACTRAIADEVRHAKLCFAFASHYGGNALGPARLDIDQCLDAVSSIEVMKLVVREGCLGETSAALEAREAADLAAAPAVKRLLTQLAEDEQRHAELAFRFLVWALDQSSSSERSELAADARICTLHFARDAEPSEGRAADLELELAAHGMLSSAQYRATRHRASSTVTGPLLDAIFRKTRSDAAFADSVALRSSFSPRTGCPPTSC